MKLAMRLPAKGTTSAERDDDPREDMTSEVIDFASRTAYPSVSQRKPGSDALGLAAGVTFVAILGAATLWGLNASRLDDGEQVQTVPQGQAEALPLAPDVPAEEFPAQTEEELAASAFPEMTDPAPAPVLAQPPGTDPSLRANPYASPTVVFDAGAKGAALPEGFGNPPADGGKEESGNSASDFASRIGGVGGGPVQARVDINPQTTVTQGTMIPAILETAIDTDVPGFVRAVVSQDVRSFDGSRILVPRSSRLIGQYQSGLQGGQKRAYVIWTRLIRPDGVSVALQSPATTFDGRAGLEGEVDSHFFQRFGSAMLLSVIGGLTAIASGGTSVILGGGQTAASTALQQDGQRSPTVRVRQGEPIRVFTARDLDFSRAPRI